MNSMLLQKKDIRILSGWDGSSEEGYCAQQSAQPSKLEFSMCSIV
jgi:hypothetical protein